MGSSPVAFISGAKASKVWQNIIIVCINPDVPDQIIISFGLHSNECSSLIRNDQHNPDIL
jgi:hypothetical protein